MIDAGTFNKDVETATSFWEYWIYLSYKVFLAFFRSKNELTPLDLVIGDYFTYAWMSQVQCVGHRGGAMKFEAIMLSAGSLALIKA